MRDELKKTLDYLEAISPNAREELKSLENLPKKRDSLVRLAGSALWNLTGSIKPPIFSPCHSPAKDGVFLGHVLDRDNIFGPLFLPLSIFLLGVAILGASGTGKTTLIINFIIPALINAWKRVIAFDPTGQYRGVLPAMFGPDKLLLFRPERYRWNPLLPPRYLTLDEWKRMFLDILRFMYVGDGMVNLAREGLNYVYSNYSTPTLFHLKSWLERLTFKSHERNYAHWQSLKNRIDMIWDSFGEAWNCASGFFENSTQIDRSIIFEMTLDSLTGNLFMDLFTEFQRCCHSPFSSELNLVFIYEEAHVRFSTDIHRRETQILERVALQQARQQRKHGLGAVYVDQIGLFPVQVFGNLGTFVLFRLTDENSLRRVADAIGLDEEQRAEVKTLEQRRCVVFSHVC